ncbi:BlaI/MecI/CopY family transcriptional regulator [Rhodoflexus caldus]|uniref:BlaI/MecI/CopY family transcriptional regulator n=1 Tax=Rhodoflexus caldus TaxID=2891236 RepID=UPI002029F0C8|nr:BlaI/MecI/CopY family transcriptional regulator [Rhodoflexus caldus]
MKQEHLKPTESELEILQVLWAKGASTVREVNEQLNLRRETGYTTTLKIMQIMTEKGLLTRDESQRTHVYSAAVQEQDTQKQLLDKFLDSVFKGSTTNLVMQALGNSQTTADELREIRKLIDDIEKGGAK